MSKATKIQIHDGTKWPRIQTTSLYQNLFDPQEIIKALIVKEQKEQEGFFVRYSTPLGVKLC